MRRLSKWIFFKLMGWELRGAYTEIPAKCILICVPHTSWHDFYHGILIRNILKLKIGYLGKEELFKSPMGWFFRWTGGIPVNRSSKQNYVLKLAKEFEQREVCRVALAPEGTRKQVDRLKTGFYHIARAANIPIVMVTFDYEHKVHKFSKPFYTTSNMDTDMEAVYSFFSGIKGKVPEWSFFAPH